MTRVCEFCGGKLPPDHTRFCSGKCLAKFRETKRIAKVCLVCGQRFYVTPWEAGRRFCSIRCSGLAKRKGETITCEYCGQAFYATRDALAKGTAHYRSVAQETMVRVRSALKLNYLD